ncbi:thiamine pyrophosphate-dependent enzyme [Kordiimonas lipolytica]|uniref:Thiamine pyrophosphate-dependent enzyme n=1 Tax=Kordiimonas lipolytica TaxID=1662421 RepID=A0ABV8UFV5_9PROT
MNRVEAIQSIQDKHPTAAIIYSNGLTSREAAHFCHRPGNYYLLHGMGEALSVGVGLKQARPDIDVVVVDGDGNAAMGLASSCMLPLEGLTYYVLDNQSYETTGGQPTFFLDDKVPQATVIKIATGKEDTPNPPAPEQIQAEFSAWLARK